MFDSFLKMLNVLVKNCCFSYNVLLYFYIKIKKAYRLFLFISWKTVENIFTRYLLIYILASLIGFFIK